MKLCDEYKDLFRNRVKLELELISRNSGTLFNFLVKSDEKFFEMLMDDFEYFLKNLDTNDLFKLRCIFADEVNKLVLFTFKKSADSANREWHDVFERYSQNQIFSPKTILFQIGLEGFVNEGECLQFSPNLIQDFDELIDNFLKDSKEDIQKVQEEGLYNIVSLTKDENLKLIHYYFINGEIRGMPRIWDRGVDRFKNMEDYTGIYEISEDDYKLFRKRIGEFISHVRNRYRDVTQIFV